MNLSRHILITVSAATLIVATSARAQETNTPAATDYAAFSRFIANRNIFDPNRQPRVGSRPRPVVRTRTVDSFSLVGTMEYPKGTFAFFDGTSSGYRKVLEMGGKIGEFTVTAMTPHSVTLISGTNEFTLKVNSQLRSEDGGPWSVSLATDSYASNGSSRYSGRDSRRGYDRRSNNNFTRNATQVTGQTTTGDATAETGPAMEMPFPIPMFGDGPPEPPIEAEEPPTEAPAEAAAQPATDSNDPLARLRALRAAQLGQQQP